MKALSIRQPWAWLIVNGYKDVENRPWDTNYRGPLLIHAPKQWDQNGFEFIIENKDLWVPEKDKHTFGAIVGSVDMIDCVDECDSEWFYGPYGFVFENPKCFSKIIPYRGQLGLFDVPIKLF
jgi:hypothetical protein